MPTTSTKLLGIDVGKKHCGVCVWNVETQQIEYWAIWEFDDTRAKDIINALDQYRPTLPHGIGNVVVEHQPIKNPLMVRIMFYLECYFTIHGYTVHFQDSKLKLAYASSMSSFPNNSTDCEWTYRHRKNLAVQTVATFIDETSQPLASVFQQTKKKDDLADALLHAMAFAKFQKSIGQTKCSMPTSEQKRIIARAPTEKQTRTGKLTPSNVKFLLRDIPRDEIEQYLCTSTQKSLRRCFEKHFGPVKGDGVAKFKSLCP